MIESHRREEEEGMATGKKVRVAIIGVGNCASSLVQGVEFYKNAPEDEFVPGLMHVKLGDYHGLAAHGSRRQYTGSKKGRLR